MNYTSLSIHQRITLKGIIADRRNREFLSHRSDHSFLDACHALSYLTNWRFAINKMLELWHYPFRQPIDE